MLISNKWFVVGDYSVSERATDYKYMDSPLIYGGCGCCGGGPDSAIESEPVARLMASAPELLQALRDIEKWGQDSVSFCDLLDRLKDIEFKEE